MDTLHETTIEQDLGPKRFVNLTPLAIGMVLLLALFGGARIYQQAFAWSMGTDSTSPEFAKYWMTFLYVELVVLAILGPCIWLYVWVTRDRHLDRLSPQLELRRHFTLTALLTVGAILAWWSTEVVYSQQVIYAFDSQEAVSPK